MNKKYIKMERIYIEYVGKENGQRYSYGTSFPDIDTAWLYCEPRCLKRKTSEGRIIEPSFKNAKATDFESFKKLAASRYPKKFADTVDFQGDEKKIYIHTRTEKFLL